MRRATLALVVLALSSRAALAADPVPGNSCAGTGANSWQWAGAGPDGGYFNGMFCNTSGTYTGIINFQSTGQVGIGTTNPGALLDIGLAGTTLGTERLEGSTSGYVQLQPAAAAGSWTMTLPATTGTSGQFLKTNGSGVTSWATVTATAVPAGSDKQVQLNNNGVFYASSGLTFNSASGVLAIPTGSVGIGTTTPSAMLDVEGSTNGVVILGSSSGTASPYGVYGTLTGVSNYGAAVIGINYGTTGANYGVYGQTNSTNNNAVAGYFTDNVGSGNGVGVFGTSSSTGAASGVLGEEVGSGNTGYGVRAVNNSASGYSIYANGTSPSYFAGDVGIGTTSPGALLGLQDNSSTATVPMFVAGDSNTTAYTKVDQYGNFTYNGNIWLSWDNNRSSDALSTNSQDLYITTDSAGGSNNNVILYPQGTGKVGVGTAAPQATLDVSGYVRLAKNSSQPVACSSTNDGAIALTAVYTLCVCKGGSTAWVQSKDGSTACSW